LLGSEQRFEGVCALLGLVASHLFGYVEFIQLLGDGFGLIGVQLDVQFHIRPREKLELADECCQGPLSTATTATTATTTTTTAAPATHSATASAHAHRRRTAASRTWSAREGWPRS
jgi:hypothetical protein